MRDFEAFVQATGYDAVGGMASAVTQNGFKLNDDELEDAGIRANTGASRLSA